MEKIAAAVNMAMVVEQGQIVLTSSAEHRGALRPRRYAVSDLTLGDARAAADLAQVLQTLVVPQSWQAGGGQGTVEVSPDALRVVQTGHVHHQVLVFCEKLRVARGLAPKSGRDPRKFALATRTARARDMLGRFTSVQVSAATPLESALAQFKHPTGTEIFIDCPALAAAGIAGNATKALKIDNRPQGEALRQLLEPMGLAWRAVDADVLQVTTQKAVAARMELEFFPVGKLLAGQPPAALIEKIKAKLPGAAWGAGGGALHFDPASQSLIVLQSQPVQMAVESLLGEK
jgi:hypothetical protein